MELSMIEGVLLGLVLMGGAWGLVAGAVKVARPFALLVTVLTLIHVYPDLSTRLGTYPTVRFFLPLLIVFIGLVLYGFVAHVLRGAVQLSRQGLFNHLMGLGLGLVTGTVVAGALVWWLKSHVGIHGSVLLRGAVLAPVAAEFFQIVIAFAQRLFPRPQPEYEPWWKRPLW